MPRADEHPLFRIPAGHDRQGVRDARIERQAGERGVGKDRRRVEIAHPAAPAILASTSSYNLDRQIIFTADKVDSNSLSRTCKTSEHIRSDSFPRSTNRLDRKSTRLN